MMLRHILPHKLAEDLGGRLILRPTYFQELLSQIALHPYAKAGIFHGAGVYPTDTHLYSLNWLSASAGEFRANIRSVFLPQICHKPKRTDSDNGGFVRVTEGRYFVAKTAPKGRFFP